MDPVTLPPRRRDPQSAHVSSDHYDTPSEQQPDNKQHDSFVVEVFKFAVLALVIVVPFRLYVAQPFIVNGASMAPTFATGEYLIVDQVSYRLHQPVRGDVVIFRYPNDPSKFFIKRIIGLPGEVVELANGYTTIIDPASGDELLLDEPYIVTDRTDDHLSITLSGDEYFVMGDNRAASSDSRVWGPVPRDMIVGKAFVRLLPPRTFALHPGEFVYTDAN